MGVSLSAILKRRKKPVAPPISRRAIIAAFIAIIAERCRIAYGIMPALPDARAYYRPDQYDELPLDMMRGAIATG